MSTDLFENAKLILAIPKDEPERLFSGREAVEAEYRALARKWHPDLGADAAIFAHINILHDLARLKIDGTDGHSWRTPGLLELTSSDGIPYRIKYIKEFDAGLARGYMGHSIVAYVFPLDLASLVTTAERTILGFSFPNAELEKKTRPGLVALKKVFRTNDKVVMVMERPAETIRLRDLLDHCGGKLDPRHVMWIMSELLNLACWFGFAKLTHNDLSLDNLFVTPATHKVHIVGGWATAVPLGERMARKQTSRTVANLPSDVERTKMASFKTDLGMIRLIGRELLGDASGMRLLTDKSVPKPFTDWLRMATSGVGKTDYVKWQDILTASYGPRRFTELAVTFSDVYKE